MLKLFEMFSGFGGASFSLKKAGINFECVGISEIDKNAIQCFNTNFPNIKNYGDCTKINPYFLPDFDLLTGGFPCQPFSVAGNKLGELDTRGTLFYEIVRIAEVKKPTYMVLENVKGLTAPIYKNTFDRILSELKRIGYDVLWKILDTKDYGIPQHRERIFFICKLGKWNLYEFQFPKEEKLSIGIKDLLEKCVDKKYYLSYVGKKNIKEHLIKKEREFITTKVKSLEDIISQKSVLHTEKKNNEYLSSLNIKPEELIFLQHRVNEIREFYKVCPTLVSTGIKPIIIQPYGGFNDFTLNIEDVVRSLRKLTPKEFFRLMGFLDDEIKLDGLSDVQRYKLAGNGWDINLVSKLFREMFGNDKTKSFVRSLKDF